jgi:hypothetical protein
LGLGTTSPATDIHIVNSGAAQFLLQAGASDTAYFLMGDAADTNIGWIAYDNSNDSMSFRTNNATQMTLDSGGNVGIGTDSPTAVSGTTVLEITGTSGNAGAEVIIGSSDTTATANDLFGGLAFKSIDSNGTPPHYSGIKARAADAFGGASLEFYAGRSNYESNDPRFVIEGPQSVSGEAMRITSAGNVGIGTSSPANALSVTGAMDVSSNMGVGGGTAPNVGVYTRYVGSGATTQYGLLTDFTGSAAATAAIHGTYSRAQTAAAAFTSPLVTAFYAANALKGSGSTITNLHGLYIADQTAGTNNYGITSTVTSDTNKWNIYASGTAANYFAGNVGIGTTSPASVLHLTGAATGVTVEGTTRADLFLIDSGAPTDQKRKTIRSFDGDLIFGTENDAINDFAEAMRIDSSGNLLVGTTTSPSGSGGISLTNRLTAGYQGVLNGFGGEDSSGLYYSGSTSNGYVAINSNGSNAPLYISLSSSATTSTFINFSDNTTGVGSIGVASSNPYFASGSVGLKLTSEVLPCDNNGASADGFLDLGGASDRFNNLYLSGGVYLGGTGAANQLDDYEEGTWTPTIEGSTSGSITGFTISGANYTKVGRVVNLNCYLSSVDISSSTISGEVRIASLPFTSANFTGVILSTYCNWFTLDESDITVSGYTQGAELRLLKGSSTSPITDSDLSTGVTNGVIMVNVVYMTS